MIISVGNGKCDGFVGNNKIYIGRYNKSYNLAASPLANPFTIGKDGDRNHVISKYRQWLWQQLQFDSDAKRELISIRDRILNNEDLILTCWCHPLHCHGDIIVKCLKWMLCNYKSKL